MHKSIVEIQPHRDVTTTNFASGQIRFRLFLGDNEKWNPYESFFNIRCKLTKANGDLLDHLDGVGANMFMGDSLFQSMKLNCNDICINEQQDYCHQISVLRQRLNKPDQWLETAGKSLNFTQADIKDRIESVSSNGGYSSLNSLNFDTITDNHRYTLTAATNRITVSRNAGGVLPDVRQAFKLGDELRYVQNDASIAKQKIVAFVSATELTVENVPADKVAAAIALDLTVRKNEDKRNVKEFELMWKPGLGVFQEVHYPLPGGCVYECILTPFPSLVLQRNAIESLASKTPDVDYKFEVVNMKMHVCKYKYYNPQPQADMEISFDQVRCQAQTLNTNSINQKQFDVHPYAHSLTVTYQDNKVGQETQFSRARFKIENDEELNLSRLYMIYANVTLPNPIPDINYDESNNKDFLVQRYMETQLYSKGLMHPSVESIEKWRERGAMYHFKWPRGYDKKHEKVTVSQNFRSAFTDKPQVLLFDWHRKSVKFIMGQGKLSHVAVSQ